MDMADKQGKQPGTQYTWEYAFTVTLRPIMFKTNAETQYDKSIMILKEILDKYKLKYTLVAELTRNMNIHYHGIVQFPINLSKNVMKWWHDKFRNHKVIGFVNIKVCDNVEGWLDYMTKDFVNTYESVGRRPLIKHQDNFSQEIIEKYAMQW